jgi:hypothetical protein
LAEVSRREFRPAGRSAARSGPAPRPMARFELREDAGGRRGDRRRGPGQRRRRWRGSSCARTPAAGAAIGGEVLASAAADGAARAARGRRRPARRSAARSWPAPLPMARLEPRGAAGDQCGDRRRGLGQRRGRWRGSSCAGPPAAGAAPPTAPNGGGGLRFSAPFPRNRAPTHPQKKSAWKTRIQTGGDRKRLQICGFPRS